MAEASWDAQFAALVRRSRPGYWGNWSLDPAIAPGAVGVLNPFTGEFRSSGDALPGAVASKRESSQDWSLMSESVTRNKLSGDVGVAATEPGTGIEGSVDVGFEWTMEKKGSMVSEFVVIEEESLDLDDIMAQLEWLKTTAASMNAALDGTMAQGFGVITDVIWASDGINVGALSDATTFSITGTVGLKHKVAPAQGTVKASWSEMKENKSVDKHVWPSKKNKTTSKPVPIAFAFASFDGTTILPRWIQLLAGFDVLINSSTTYQVNAELSYAVAGQAERVTRDAHISAGLHAVFNSIPLSATDVKLRVAFDNLFGEDTVYEFPWPTPLTTFAGGKRQVDLVGLWPDDGTAIDVQAATSTG